MKFKFVNSTAYIPYWASSNKKCHTDILLRMIGFKPNDTVHVLIFDFEYKMKDFTLELHLKSLGKQYIECIYGTDEEYCEAMTEIANKDRVSNIDDLIFMYNIIKEGDIDFKTTAKLDVEYVLYLKNDKMIKKDTLSNIGLNSDFEFVEEFLKTFLNNSDPNIPRIVKELFKVLDPNDYSTIDEQISLEQIESQNDELKRLLGE